MMIKDKQLRANKKSNNFRWGVCIDGSPQSVNALMFTQFLVHPELDEVVGITVDNGKIDIDACKKAAEGAVDKHVVLERT
jgi:hypothetical protein